MRCHLKALFLGLVVTSVLLISGCGGQKVIPIKGKVVLPEGVELGDDDSVAITFIPNDDKLKSGSARTKGKDTSFEVMTGKGKGLMPGAYKVAAKIDIYPGSNKNPHLAAAMGEFNSRYNPGGSRLSYTVTEDSGQSITIDLDQGTVTASK